LSVWVSYFSMSMKLAVSESSFVLFSIIPSENSVLIVHKSVLVAACVYSSHCLHLTILRSSKLSSIKGSFNFTGFIGQFSLAVHVSLWEVSFIDFTVSPSENTMAVFFSVRESPIICWSIIINLFALTLGPIVSPVSIVHKYWIVSGSFSNEFFVTKDTFSVETVVLEASSIVRSVGEYHESIPTVSNSIDKGSMEVDSWSGENLSFSVLFSSIPVAFVEHSRPSQFEEWQILGLLSWCIDAWNKRNSLLMLEYLDIKSSTTRGVLGLD